MGELTDSTNRAEGFCLMPVVWGLGATVGYVKFIANFWSIVDGELGH